MSETVIPAQPGWRVVRTIYEADQEPCLLWDIPIVAWRIGKQEAEPVVPSIAGSFQDWIGGGDKQEDGCWVLVSPEGRVLSGGEDYDGLEQFMRSDFSQWLILRSDVLKPKIQRTSATPR